MHPEGLVVTAVDGRALLWIFGDRVPFPCEVRSSTGLRDASRSVIPRAECVVGLPPHCCAETLKYLEAATLGGHVHLTVDDQTLAWLYCVGLVMAHHESPRCSNLAPARSLRRSASPGPAESTHPLYTASAQVPTAELSRGSLVSPMVLLDVFTSASSLCGCS